MNWTLKGQLDLEQHGGRTPEGIIARVLTRILALTAAIWYNDKPARTSRDRSPPTTTGSSRTSWNHSSRFVLSDMHRALITDPMPIEGDVRSHDRAARIPPASGNEARRHGQEG